MGGGDYNLQSLPPCMGEATLWCARQSALNRLSKLKQLLVFLLADPRRALELLLATGLVHLLGLVGTVFVILVFNYYLPYGVDTTLVTLALGALIAACAEWGFRAARVNLSAGLSGGPNRGLGAAVFDQLANGNLALLERLPSAARQESMRSLDASSKASSPAALGALLDVPFGFLYLLALALLSPWLGLIVLLCLLAGTVLIAAARQGLRRGHAALLREEVQMRAAFTNTIAGQETIRLFGAADTLSGKWRGLWSRVLDLRDALYVRQESIQNACALLLALQNVAVISVGATMAYAGSLSMGALVGANMLAARALAPLLRLLQTMDTYTEADQSRLRIEELLRMPREAAQGTALKQFAGRLELSDVAFLYPGSNTPLFERLSLIIPPGSLVAVVGPNGSGKTTLAQLLAGLRPPVRGQILVDGVGLSQLAPRWWRQQLVYLAQEPTFLEGSIRENILLGRSDASAEQLSSAIHDSGLAAWLHQSPQGLDAPVADGGARLAVGIRKRLSLARALLVGGRLVVADEPTAGLDAAGRLAHLSALHTLHTRGATVIVVTEDPQILQAANIMIDLGSKPVPRVVFAPQTNQSHGNSQA